MPLFWRSQGKGSIVYFLKVALWKMRYKQHECPSRNDYISHLNKETAYIQWMTNVTYTIPRTRNNRASSRLPSKMGRWQTVHLIPKKQGGKKAKKLLKMLESKKQKLLLEGWLLKKMSWMVACWRKVAKTKSGIGCWVAETHGCKKNENAGRNGCVRLLIKKYTK